MAEDDPKPPAGGATPGGTAPKPAGPTAPKPSGGGGGGKPQPNYKRSWKNLLINRRYQLQFTLFMVGLAALLMVGLGWRVMSKANEATTVGKVHILGKACTQIPQLSEELAPAPSDKVEEKTEEPPAPGSGSADGSGAGSGSADAAGSAAPVGAANPVLVDVITQWCNDSELTCSPMPEVGKPLTVKATAQCDDAVDYKLGDTDAIEPLKKARIKVVLCEGGKKHDVPTKSRRAKPTIDESSLQLTFTLPPDYSDSIADHWKCELEQRGELEQLDHRKLTILLVLVGSGLLLLVGLTIYGINSTHKVAGPLFKISLYLTKMRDGRYDKVYNLRKGDQLVNFYDHFKAAHAGVVVLQHADIAQLTAVIAAAESAGIGEHPSVVELREILARKEKSVE